MSKTVFKLNKSGIRELLRSESMKTIVEKKANEAVQRLGSGYNRNSYVGKNRVNSTVYAESFEAKRDNYKNNTILKAVK